MNVPHAHKVMFVDDEEGVRKSWLRFLGERGFDVTTAVDGDDAITHLNAEPVDVVVADLRMPGLDGLQLLEWVHDRRPDTPFILLTGYGTEDVERRARALGAYDYLNKPISPDALAAVITAASQLEKARRPAVERTVQATAEAVTRAETDVPSVERADRPGALRSVLEVAGGLIAAPLLGLAFVMFLPLIGFAAFFWFLGERLWKGKEVVTP